MAIFISYSWDSQEHIDWVRKLAERLCKDGIEVNLDQWDLAFGEQVSQFVETSIRENDYVLIICTPAYKKKSDCREGGVGFEGNIINAELLYKKNYFKFIPILRSGEWEEAAPSSILGSFFADLRESNRKYEDEYIKLRNWLRGARVKPPVGLNGTAKWDEIKICKVTEYLLGRAFSSPRGIRYTDGNWIDESDIENLAEELVQYTRNGGWIDVLHKDAIDEIINSHSWRNGTKIYSYNEAERNEIMARCARSIKYRLEQYVGESNILYNIFPNGNIGFRYKLNNDR